VDAVVNRQFGSTEGVAIVSGLHVAGRTEAPAGSVQAHARKTARA
jgi:hypothetical protein